VTGVTTSSLGKSKIGPGGGGGPVKQSPEQTVIPAYTVSLKVGQRQFFGEGHTQQAAKHNAASKALAVLKAPESQALPSKCTDVKSSNLNPASVPFVPASMKHAAAAATTPSANAGPSNPSPETVTTTTSAATSSRGAGYASATTESTVIEDKFDEIKSPISLVHECALKRNLTVSFEIVKEVGPPHMRTFVMKCIMGDVATRGEGNGKRAAKKKAAENMIEMLKTLPPVASCQLPASSKKKAGTSAAAKNKQKAAKNLVKMETLANPDYGQTINPISRLIQIQQAKKEKEPVYTLIEERGLPRKREFVMKVTINGYTTQGRGPNKKLAKRVAAESLLRDLGYFKPALVPGKPVLKPTTSSGSVGADEATQPPQSNATTTTSVTASSVEEKEINTAPADSCEKADQSSLKHSSSRASTSSKGAEKSKKLTFVHDVTSNSKDTSSGNTITKSSSKVNEPTTSSAAAAGSTTAINQLVPIKLQNGGTSTATKSKMNSSSSEAGVSETSPLEATTTTITSSANLVKSAGSSDQLKSNVQSKNSYSNQAKPTTSVNKRASSLQNNSKSNKPLVNGNSSSQQSGQNSLKQSENKSKRVAGSNQVSSSAAKKELDALSKMLDFQVIYKTFPQTKGPSSDLVTLVTLKTKPPKFCHGSGRSTEESQNDAASHALLLISGETDTETIAPVTATLEGQAAAAATEAIAATSSKSKVSGVNVVESDTAVGSNQVADDGIIVVSAAAAAPSSNVIQSSSKPLSVVKASD